MTAASPVTAKVHAARPAGAHAGGGADGGSRLPERVSIRQAAQAETSLTQVTKAGAAKTRVDEERQRLLERRRLLEAEEQQLDTEAAAVRSDNIPS